METICFIIELFRSPEPNETARQSIRPRSERFVYDEEDEDLCPLELVMKYGIDLTDKELDRFLVDVAFTQQILNENFQKQMQRDMETAMHMHYAAHQITMDAH